MAYKTDYARVHGLGTAGEGAHHWWMQRLTSVALIPLTLFFLFPFANALGQGHDAVIATYRNWWHAFVAVAFLIVGFWHLMQGLQVVIEDYVPSKPLRTALLVTNTLLNWAFGAAGVFAVAAIAFGG
jgi:succinate dehydrogenase / fumarate reductase, membrane anchor subunit